MRIVPAVDLRDGACVQLRGGRYDDELVRLDDPVGVARHWRDLGFDRLHVVDLDAATGNGDNKRVVESICAIEGIAAQVGGGIRAVDDVIWALGVGAASVIVGTRAVTEPLWLAAVASQHPGKVSLAIDVRGGAITTEGWTHQTRLEPSTLLGSLGELDLCQVIATAVDVEGSQGGPDLALVSSLRAATAHLLGVAGGVATRDHLIALRDLGVDSVVVGTSLYTGVLDPEGLIEELQP